jgi:TM2 domain-containing membrane protein YozV
MRCNQCRGRVFPGTNFCPHCGAQKLESAPIQPRSWRCPQCGRSNDFNPNQCPRCDWRSPFPTNIVVRTNPHVKNVAEIPKNKNAYILLGLFFGSFGIHNFYAGRIEIGLMQLLITLFSLSFLFLIVPFFFLLGVWIWVFIDLVSVNRDGYGRRMR